MSHCFCFSHNINTTFKLKYAKCLIDKLKPPPLVTQGIKGWKLFAFHGVQTTRRLTKNTMTD